MSSPPPPFLGVWRDKTDRNPKTRRPIIPTLITPESIVIQPKKRKFSKKHSLIIGFKGEEVLSAFSPSLFPPPTMRIGSLKLFRKEEFHITVLGYDHGTELIDYCCWGTKADNPEPWELIEKLASAQEWKLAYGVGDRECPLYLLVHPKEGYSLVAGLSTASIAAFYEKVYQTLFELRHSKDFVNEGCLGLFQNPPAAHITLMTNEGGHGVGVYSGKFVWDDGGPMAHGVRAYRLPSDVL